ncbi:hypothetical protein GW17_00036127 [Ensete ventricosum]|nr:hypothetical protein GW17_00036127 [Ensete ventricosum]
MPELRISKKHHKHINNPFPSTPKCLPFIHGKLSFSPHKISQDQSFQIGEDFQLAWSCRNGGCLSISHRSQPDRSIWSTIPGEAFISAAAVQTQVEESRGSFAIKDGDVLFICKHQSVEEIRVLYETDIEENAEDDNLLPGFSNSNNKRTPESFNKSYSPFLMITGRLFSKKTNILNKKSLYLGKKKIRFGWARKPSFVARYWFLLEQKSSNQIGFSVKFGEYDKKFSPSAKNRRILQGSSRKLIQMQRQCIAYISRQRGFVALSAQDEQVEEQVVTEFNKVFITYASDKDEKFYGFGEQFSHMEFKGKRVPIIVQEQGIGRGDQPITFAANLISYRSGGDWSTTYAPSPFYMTSKMRSLYLEGYSYSAFDLTKPDRVQIQVNREFVDDWAATCHGKEKEDPEENLVFFMRAGFRGSPKWSMLFWEGDQMEAAQRGLPVARHLFLHYPDDKHVHSLTYQQFLVGTDILVVPVLDKAKKEVKAYFPMAVTQGIIKGLKPGLMPPLATQLCL